MYVCPIYVRSLGVSCVVGAGLLTLRKLNAESAPERRTSWRHVPCQASVLGMLPVNDFSDYLTHLSRWVRVIHSWSVCDSFSLPQPKKLLREHSPELWAFFLLTSSAAGSMRCASASSPLCSTSSTMSI